MGFWMLSLVVDKVTSGTWKSWGITMNCKPVVCVGLCFIVKMAVYETKTVYACWNMNLVRRCTRTVQWQFPSLSAYVIPCTVVITCTTDMRTGLVEVGQRSNRQRRCSVSLPEIRATFVGSTHWMRSSQRVSKNVPRYVREVLDVIFWPVGREGGGDASGRVAPGTVLDEPTGSVRNVKDTLPTISLKTRDTQPLPRVASFESPWLDIIYLLTPWSRALLEKLTVSQLFKKFTAFCLTRRFITAFTSARHLSLSWASSIQSIPPIPLPADPS
jgi:hypothetical protein